MMGHGALGFGYGGGYYDRFVSAIPGALRVGLAFDLQIVEKAPLQDHDEILDLVITETRIIRANR
jgi:5-formyltetrahydrofolate cyclo-ligase